MVIIRDEHKETSSYEYVFKDINVFICLLVL